MGNGHEAWGNTSASVVVEGRTVQIRATRALKLEPRYSREHVCIAPLPIAHCHIAHNRSAMAEFRTHPHPSQWDDYVDFESTSWPKKDRRRYWIIPSICFNCESACGILAYVDKDTLDVRKIEGNPVHPGSRGRTCAKGVVTPNQLEDPDRVLYPLKRAGARGERRVEARELGRGARGHRRPDPQGDSGGPPARGHVPRRASRRGRLRQPRAAGLGHRRAQQSHQRLLVVGAARPFPLDRRRSAVARSRQREDDPAAVVASRVGPLLQPARAADHRGQVTRRQADRDRSAAVEHVGESRHVVARQSGHRSGAAPRDRALAPRHRPVQP